MGGGACLADGGRRRRIVELTCGAALRAPRAVRGSAARHRHRAGMPRGSRPLPGHVEHDAPTMGRRRGPLRASVRSRAAPSGAAPSCPERGTGRRGSCRPGVVPATTVRLGPSSVAWSTARGSSGCGGSVSRPRSGCAAGWGVRRLPSSVAICSPGRWSASRRPGRRHRWSRPRPRGSPARPNLREPPLGPAELTDTCSRSSVTCISNHFIADVRHPEGLDRHGRSVTQR